MMEVYIVVSLCLTTIVLAEQVRRYYSSKNKYDFKQARLEYDNIMLADGGKDEGDQ